MSRLPAGQRSLLALAALAACTGAPASEALAPRPDPLELAAGTITDVDVRARIGFLASDALRGRDTPSQGLEAAAAYLASELGSMGLEPAGDPGSYLQRWPYEEKRMEAEDARLTASGAGDPPALVYGREFFALPGAADSVGATPVLLGGPPEEGASFPAEVRGRIVVLPLATMGMHVLTLPRDLAAAGAVGVLYVLPDEVPAEAIAAVAGQMLRFSAAVPAFGVRREHARALLRAAGGESAEAALGAPPSSPLVLAGATVHLVARPRAVEHRVPNVAALLRGSDPALRDEYVVLSAHFDHVGVGAPDATGDSIYNGADDDASGTAVVVEVAEAFASLPVPPRRSVLFLAVSGEEKGLLGSLWFADHATIPIEAVVANINMDMVGRNAPDTVVAIGQEYTSLGPLSHEVALAHPALGLRVVEDLNPAEQAFFRSDHVAFLKKDVPSIFFTTWLHEDYHRPSDEVERIDAEKASRVARLVFLLAHRVADDPERPTWLGDGLDRVRAILRTAPFE